MSVPKYFKPGENICLKLSAVERQLLLDYVLLVGDDDELAQAIRDTPPDRPAWLTLDELERLAEDLAGISNRAEDQNFLAEVNRLYEKVDALIDGFSDEE